MKELKIYWKKELVKSNRNKFYLKAPVIPELFYIGEISVKLDIEESSF